MTKKIIIVSETDVTIGTQEDLQKRLREEASPLVITRDPSIDDILDKFPTQNRAERRKAGFKKKNS